MVIVKDVVAFVVDVKVVVSEFDAVVTLVSVIADVVFPVRVSENLEIASVVECHVKVAVAITGVVVFVSVVCFLVVVLVVVVVFVVEAVESV